MVDSLKGEEEINKSPEEGGHHQEQDPKEVEEAVGLGVKVTRRFAAAVLGAGLAELISGGALSGLIMGDEHEEAEHGPTVKESEELKTKIEAKAEEMKKQLENQPGYEKMDARERALLWVNLMGSGLFIWGVRDLLPGGAGHIRAVQYGALSVLSAFKYDLENEEGKHHLVEETESSIKALAIISGTIVGAEGLNADIEKLYMENVGKQPTIQDKIALMTMLASAISPLATTVGSASVIKRMSNEIAAGDKNFMAVCVSHISNLSGFILLGDPPFIAVNDKYGAKEGMSWQLKTMLPLAMYSLLSSTIKLNALINVREGMSKGEATTKAIADSVKGLTRNIPVLAKIIAKSFANAGKYFVAESFAKNGLQSEGGLQVQIGEVLIETLKSAKGLGTNAELDRAHHHGEHGEEGLIRAEDPKLKIVNDLMDSLLKELIAANENEPVESTTKEASETDFAELTKAINDEDHDRILELCQKLNLPQAEIFVDRLKDFHDNHAIDHSEDDEPLEDYPAKDKWNPLKIYDRATSVPRLQNGLGHSLADVVNVFPFQAGCVPFLIPIFKMGVDGLEGLPDQMKELVTFFMIMIFSMFADNYVGCKIGLDLYPEKPHIALIASIQGGSMTAIGNMANIAQFSMSDYPLATSFAKMYWHADAAVAAVAWKHALDALSKFEFMAPPKPLAKPSHQQEHTRRDIFKGIGSIFQTTA